MAENKERLINPVESQKKVIDIIDIKPEKDTIPREVKTWMEKVEANQTNDPTVVHDDTTGQVVMSPSAPVDPKIVIPISRKTFSQGFNESVSEAGRWLSEFFFRLIKIKKGQVKFKQE